MNWSQGQMFEKCLALKKGLETFINACYQRKSNFFDYWRAIVWWQKRIYILDAYLLPLPMGVRRGFHIGGANCSRLWKNSLELTKGAFASNPSTEEIK